MCLNNRSQEMGFPIQKFPDQSLFAAPRNLSQRTTSFIASQRQGIHRIPLRHLIVLEIRKRTHRVINPNETAVFFQVFRKDQFCFNRTREPAVRQGSRLVCSHFKELTVWNDLGTSFRPPLFVRDRLSRRDRMRFLFTMSIRVGAWVRKLSGRTSVRPKPLKPAPPEIEPSAGRYALTKISRSPN